VSRPRSGRRPSRRELLLAALATTVVGGGWGGSGRRFRSDRLPGAPLAALAALGESYLESRSGVSRAALEQELEARLGPWAVEDPRLRAQVASAVERDFADGDTVALGGWIVAGTEARLAALVALDPPRGR